MASRQIYPGGVTSPCRDFVAEEMKASGAKRIYIPCAGQFSVAQAFLNHGGPKKRLLTSDITFYPSLLGYLFDPGKSLDELNIVNRSELFQPRNGDDLEIAAAAILAIRYEQIPPTSQYNVNLRRELYQAKDTCLDSIRARLTELTAFMSGVRYDIRDTWDVLNEARQDPEALLFLYIPRYKGTAEREMRRCGISWNDPRYRPYDRKAFRKMVDSLETCRCRVLLYVQKSLEDLGETARNWRKVYAEPFTPKRTDYVLANTPTSMVYAAEDARPAPHRLFPIYDDHPITDASQIEFVEADAPTAFYYRDLFVHRMGNVEAQRYFLMLIDGGVSTALGLTMRDLFRGSSEYVGLVFGITCTSVRYKRLGKLFMLCLTSGDFQSWLRTQFNFGLREARGIRTAALAQHWEGKTDRSVMRLAFREQLPDGTFHLIYEGDFRKDTYQDCIRTWLKRWGSVSRGGN